MYDHLGISNLKLNILAGVHLISKLGIGT
jgi:hypothetical protein